MNKSAIQKLQAIENFEGLVEYLGDELDWPVADLDFEDLIFQYTPEEIGLDEKSAAVVTDIKRLRPLDDDQPWGIFFLELEPKKLPVVALRRLLNKMTLKQRATSNAATQTAWHADDILFISRFGESQERQLTFAHFAAPENKKDLPVLKVLGWDSGDTALKMDHVAETLREKLVWPDDPTDTENWREQWRAAFELKHREVISTSKDMASRLAQLARGIRDSIQAILEVESENGPLRQTMAAFKAALVDDLDEAGFADTYAQTITYGLLSARIADPTKNTLDDLAAHMRTNPFLKELMESFINLGGRERAKGGVGLDFDELGVSEVVDVLDTANMRAVLRDFGDLNPQEDPVIHFFEGFLQEYDKSIRKDRGVFYTPRPVVSFIVRSVDQLLRTEFGLEDGLADTTTWGEMAGRIGDLEIPEGTSPDQAFVQILDPATGTGTFLVEVIDLIYNTMTTNWQAEGHEKKKIEKLWNAYVPEHLLPRLHGYELMMAPYAIAHMKIGLKLYETGYRFESDERARVYLTNALEPAHDFSGTLAFAIPALAHEAEAVNAIKRDQRFTVVIGNPPYSGHSSNNGRWVSEMVRDYYSVDGKPLGERNTKWLQDDYVKFIRFAQENLNQSQVGILSFITNHSYLDNPTFRGMRWSLHEDFKNLTVLDLHGNRKKKEICPDGGEDQNVFDIVQGVCVLSALKQFASGPEHNRIRHSDLWGLRENKHSELSRHSIASIPWSDLRPTPPFYVFVPQDVDLRFEYETGWKITDVVIEHNVGFVTSKDHFVIDFDKRKLQNRISRFRSSQLTDEQAAEEFGLKNSSSWKLHDARKVLTANRNWEDYFTTCNYRPFDFRSIFYSNVILERARYQIQHNMLDGPNIALAVGRAGQVIDQESWNIIYATRLITDFNLFRRGGNNLLPLYLYGDKLAQQKGIELEENSRLNLSPRFLGAFAERLNLKQSAPYGLPINVAPEDIFHYAYALFYCPTYRNRYSEFLKIDFPRLPLTGDLELFCALSKLGGALIALHLMESPKLAHAITKFKGDNRHISKVSYSACNGGTVWIDGAGTQKAPKPGSNGFHGVSAKVWDFQIGGYQVCDKWLKDRKGRVLTDEDIEHYQKIVVALSETIRIMAEIDEVIEAHGGWPGAFITDNEVLSEAPAPTDEAAQQLDMI